MASTSLGSVFSNMYSWAFPEAHDEDFRVVRSFEAIEGVSGPDGAGGISFEQHQTPGGSGKGSVIGTDAGTIEVEMSVDLNGIHYAVKVNGTDTCYFHDDVDDDPGPPRADRDLKVDAGRVVLLPMDAHQAAGDHDDVEVLSRQQPDEAAKRDPQCAKDISCEETEYGEDHGSERSSHTDAAEVLPVNS
eukprot:TRINITY_DN28780_c0_g1_i1.p1 TRINITY_DN28780_c0_g1~~TRINITY_DN28780_c0_g1_i1.p1  ORF type:complete len:189 (-),score=35.65 TRINITY_DN28780_c0_g1_i1:19-585(-)